MMAAFVLAFATAAMIQFFITYCRSLLAVSSRQPLSVEVRDAAGIWEGISGRDFPRILQLLLLCSNRSQDRGPVRFVRAYYQLLGLGKSTLALAVPSLLANVEK